MARKCSKSKAVSKKIRLDQGEKIFVGIDVHKRTYHVGVWSATRERILTSHVRPSSPRDLSRYLAPYRDHIGMIVYEAGPTGFSLARHLQEENFPVQVVSPAHTPVARKQEAKSDRLDCVRLAEYASKGLLHSIYIPTLQEDGDRLLVRLREQLKRKQQQTKTQIRSLLLYCGIAEPKGLGNWSRKAIQALRVAKCPTLIHRLCLDILLDELDLAQRQVKRVTDAVRGLRREERHLEKAMVVESIPGVGALTAMSFLVELPSPERFENARQVAAMLGVAPLVRSSGETRKEVGRQRGGNRRLRSVLVEAAWRWVRFDPGANRQYRKLVGRTGNAKKAIVAMARRLGIIMWRMVTRMERYRPVVC